MRVSGQAGTADADIDAPEAWDLGTGTTNIIAASVDTGIDYTHSDLAANMWRNPGEVPGNGIDDDGNGLVDDIFGYDFFSEDADPMDAQGHGSHTSGTVGAVGENNLGVVGVCWKVRLMALRFLGPNGGPESGATQCVTYATRMGARVVNHSWGTSPPTIPDADTIFLGQQMAASAASNVMHICSAGNSAVNNDVSPQYPAAFTNDNHIVVACTDNRDQLADFSTYGPTTVDLAAPGVNTYSTVNGNRYAYYSGTSMSAPPMWRESPPSRGVRTRTHPTR